MPTTADRWAAIARLRQTVREERVEELARVERLEAAASDDLARIEAELRQWQVEARGALAGRCDLRRLQQARQAMAALATPHQTARAQQVDLRQQAEHARQALLEADRDVKMLERLTEKQQTAQRLADDRREMALLDEIAQG